MSLLSWFSPRKHSRKAAAPLTSGLSRAEPTRPVSPRTKEAVPGANGQPANRKSERMARRELLYGVVRECMVKAGVLSSSYKFKVLSLDGRGREFLLMVDLARAHGADTARLAEIEATIAQSAKLRHDIVVTAVYWRMNEHVAVGLVAAPARPAHAGPEPLEASSAPVPLDSQPAALDSRPSPPQAPRAKGGGHFEPIDPDEVAAFKEALAAGVARPPVRPAARSFDGASVQGPQSYTLLTGFEDTELPDERLPSSLSATQYGDLR